jgi:septum formation protein
MKTKIILASKSPRRQELLRLMDMDFRIVLKEVDESYPDGLIAPLKLRYTLPKRKPMAFDEEAGDEIVLTADTIVEINGLILGKPETAWSMPWKC